MRQRTASIARTIALLGAAALASANAGCMSGELRNWFTGSPKNPPVPRGYSDQDTSPSKTNGELAEAHELFRQQEYSKAGDRFRRISENKANSAAVAEEGLYYEAECMRLRGKLTAAESIYKKQLHEFASGAYKQQGCQRLYDIAVEWLKETDREMTDLKEGKGTWFIPASLRINLDSSKPTFDAETRAVQALEVVHYSDITGPLADKALFLAGYVKFYREDYHEADHFFTALMQYHKDSKLAPQACELAIVCKTLAASGSEYDGRKLAEARQMIDMAMKSYPELMKDEAGRKKMMDHLYAVTAAQAEKDMNRAAYYERTKHFGSAYYMYQLVQRRFPNTIYATQATERIEKLKPEMDKAKNAESEVGWFDGVHRRWNKIWGIDETKDAGPAGASPQALPAGIGPGR
jgi:outer membrane protein assembly factor BamD (BamD/ComL family)